MHADLSTLNGTAWYSYSIVNQISACIRWEGYRPVTISNEPTAVVQKMQLSDQQKL